MEQRRLAVVDLDGTLVVGNTFHTYFRLGIKNLLRRGHVITFASIAFMSLLRFMRLISHRQLKFYSFRCLEVDSDEFRQEIHFNPRVAKLLRQLADAEVHVLLATAAADVYVPWIWQGKYIATVMSGDTELRGERKLSAVKEYMSQHSFRLYAVVTDHYDDLPLLNAGAERNILVSPSQKTLRAATGVPHLEILR